MLTQEQRTQYRIPAIPVLGDIIPARDPAWQQSLHDDRWWERENIGSTETFLRMRGNKDIEKETKRHADFVLLHEILLAIGGSETCFPDYEEDMKKILQSGRCYPGRSKMMKGRACHCHANAAELWYRNHVDKDVRICTGYALSEDGMWRQHTWLNHYYETKTQHRMRIIETTVKRVAYFGAELTDEEAERFAYANDF